MSAPRPLHHLMRDVERALEDGLGHRDLVPMLGNVVSLAPEGSPESIFGQLKLAEILVSRDPWRAARLASTVARRYQVPHAWAVFGLACSLLGHFRTGQRAYRRALADAPHNPWYSHNLGHLLDVAEGRPRDALVYLERAHLAQPADREIAGSLAHALLRVGERPRALELLTSFMDLSEAEGLLTRWAASPTTPRRKKPPMREPSDSLGVFSAD